MKKGDPCVIAYPDGALEDAVFWEDLDGHSDVILWDTKVCLLPDDGTIMSIKDAALLRSIRAAATTVR